MITSQCPCPRSAPVTGTRAGTAEGRPRRRRRPQGQRERGAPLRTGPAAAAGTPAGPQAAGRSRGSPTLPRAIGAGAGQNQRGSRPRRVGAAAAPADVPREPPPRAGQSSALQPPQHSPGPCSAAPARSAAAPAPLTPPPPPFVRGARPPRPIGLRPPPPLIGRRRCHVRVA